MAKPQPFAPHAYAVSLSTTDTTSEDKILWNWKGTHWENASEDDAERDAYKWLEKNSFEHTTAANAKSAVSAAKLHLPKTPSKDSPNVIIPCLNEYVHVFDDRIEQHPHDRTEGIKHLISCDYDPSNNLTPLFTNLLNTSLPSLAIRSRVQEYIGYTLIRDARFQRAQIWKGSGANGKGVLANVVQALHHKTTAIDPADLKGFKLSSMIGASLMYVDECPMRGIQEQTLKSLIAGEAVQIDRKYKDPITTKILGKWVILANHMPATTDQSEGFWRRFDIIPFDHTVSENKRIANLADQIINTELSGVLNWALEGLMRLLKRGHFEIELPPEMVEAKSKAKQETNSMEAWFIEEDISVGSLATTSKTKVYEHYSSWCKRSGMIALASPRFWGRMKQDKKGLLNLRDRKSGGYLCNIILNTPAADWVEEKKQASLLEIEDASEMPTTSPRKVALTINMMLAEAASEERSAMMH